MSGKKIGYSYIRFSFSRQGKGDSVRRQEADRDAWCQRNGVTLDATVRLRDMAVSAFSGKHRSNPDRYALAVFLEMIQQGDVQRDSYLIVENLDRLSREHVRAATTLFLAILDAGVNIVTTSPEKVYRHDSTDMADIIMAVMELSRGHSESLIKSQRVKAAWGKRKEAVASKPLKELLPLWLDVKGEKVVERPGRVEVVKRVFQEVIDGKGIGQVMRGLNADGVKTFKPRVRGDLKTIWQKSSLARLIKNRAVLGELEVDGEVKKLLPQIISDGDFARAANAVEGRKGTGGRERGKAKNLFTSLVIDGDDGTRWSLAASGNGGRKDKAKVKYIENTAGQQQGAKRKALPYDLFECILLEHVREVTPADVLPPADQADGNQLADLAGKVAAKEILLRHLRAALNTHTDAQSLIAALVEQEREWKALVEQHEALKRQLATPVGDGLTQFHSLVDLLASDDSDEMRGKVRAKLAAVVESIKVWFTVPAEGASYGSRRVRFRIAFRNTPYNVDAVGVYSPGRYKHPGRLSVIVINGGLPRDRIRRRKPSVAPLDAAPALNKLTIASLDAALALDQAAAKRAAYDEVRPFHAELGGNPWAVKLRVGGKLVGCYAYDSATDAFRIIHSSQGSK